MRVNPDPYAGLLTALAEAKQNQNRATSQLASGRRVGSVSEDPAAWAMEIENSSRSAVNDEFLHSIASIRSVLSTADSTLSSAVTSMQRAITLGVEGGSSTQSAANRKGIAAEVAGIRDQMLGLANLSLNGCYVFAGTKSDAPPFAIDPSTGNVVYSGSSNVNQVEVGETRTIQSGLSGETLFLNPAGDVFGSLGRLANALKANDTAAIQSATAEIHDAFSHLTATRVFYGNAMNQLDSDETFLNGQKLQFATRENELVGADPIKAATDLAQAQTIYNASVAATGKISTLSLLDYLK